MWLRLMTREIWAKSIAPRRPPTLQELAFRFALVSRKSLNMTMAQAVYERFVSLLVCASNLPALQEYAEARQLRHSLLRCVASPAFAPKSELDGELLKKLLPGNAP
jgi:hypothetical protein